MAQVCVGDSAYIAAAGDAADAIVKRGLAEIAIQLAISLWRRNVAERINDMKTEIADRQVALAEAAHGHAASFYPQEAALVADAMSLPKNDPVYALSDGWRSFSAESNNRGRSSWLKASAALCIFPNQCDDARWSNHAKRNEVDTGNFAMRQAENRAQALNDVRYARQLGALAIGQGRIGAGAGYSDAAGTILGNVGKSILGSIDSAASALGYALNRNAKPQWQYGYEPQSTSVREMRGDSNVVWGNRVSTNYDSQRAYLSTNYNYDTYGTDAVAPVDRNNSDDNINGLTL
jgi:hypothetical protein